MNVKFEFGLLSPITDLPQAGWEAVARGVGAVLGSAISLAYVLPHGRREAAARFATGVSFGILFGPLAGIWIVDKLDLSEAMSRGETVLAGSAAASLCAWWGLGVLRRLFEKPAKNKNTLN